MKRLYLFLLMLTVGIFFATPVFAITADEIIDRLDDNQQFETSYGEGRMIVTDRFGTRVSTFEMYSRGEEDSLIEFTSIEERGQKILRTENEIYLFYPDAEELIRLQGSALRDSVLGSDVSYEDMTGGKDRADKYKKTLLGEEIIDGTNCYKVELIANTRDVPYQKQIVWITADTFAFKKAEYFALSGRILKEILVEKIDEIDGKYVPVHYVMSDRMKRNSSTEFIIDEIDVNLRLDRSIFSLEELTW